jgi:ankyrin repeat protein
LHEKIFAKYSTFSFCARLYLAAGVIWLRRDDQGCTALHIAAARNRGAVVDELLKFGAG